MIYKKILVTGSSGVLGSALKETAKNHSGRDFTFLKSQDCDLTDANKTLNIVKSTEPDAILNLAAVSGGIGLGMKHQASLLRDNMLMAINILEGARKCKIRKTVMALSSGMYPPNAPLPLNEDTIHDGYPHLSFYGYFFAKRMVDPAIRAYREEYGINVIGLIPNGIFGENDNYNFDDAPMLPSLIRRFYENRDNESEIVVWGDGTPLREYTYSKDIANAFMWALDNYDDDQCLNVGSIEENSISEIAIMIAEILSIDRKRIIFDATKPKGVFKKSTDNSRFLALSDFQYTSFRKALEKTIEWFVDAYENHHETIRLYSKSKEKL